MKTRHALPSRRLLHAKSKQDILPLATNYLTLGFQLIDNLKG